MSFEADLATLSLHLDGDESTPLYQQLANQLREWIAVGRIGPGERLPSSRKLAQLLGISRTSSLNAYAQLVADGVLETRPAQGVYVTELGAALRQPAEGSDAERRAPAAAVAEIETASVFNAGADVSQFPATEWARALARVWRRPDPALLQGLHPGGYWPLRQAVARYIKAVRGVDCSPQHVIITAGNRDGLALLGRALLRPGQTVALENPCYPPLRHGFAALGVKLATVAVDEQGAQLPSCSSALAWLTPARQYPLGVSMALQRRLDWLAYSQQQQCWLVEDDYDSEFLYRKATLPPLFSLAAQLYHGPERRVILVGSFSKLIFKTLRIGYLIVPPALIETVLDAHASLGSLASVPIQPALADFIGHRRFASHLRRMRRCYQQRRNYLHGLLLEHLAPWMQSELPSCGMHLLAHLTASAETGVDVELTQRLAQQGINAPALAPHYVADAQQGLLLGFSGSSEAGMAHGVTQLRQQLQRLLP